MDGPLQAHIWQILVLNGKCRIPNSSIIVYPQSWPGGARLYTFREENVRK